MYGVPNTGNKQDNTPRDQFRSRFCPKVPNESGGFGKTSSRPVHSAYETRRSALLRLRSACALPVVERISSKLTVPGNTLIHLFIRTILRVICAVRRHVLICLVVSRVCAPPPSSLRCSVINDDTRTGAAYLCPEMSGPFKSFLLTPKTVLTDIMVLCSERSDCRVNAQDDTPLTAHYFPSRLAKGQPFFSAAGRMQTACHTIFL